MWCQLYRRAFCVLGIEEKRGEPVQKSGEGKSTYIHKTSTFIAHSHCKVCGKVYRNPQTLHISDSSGICWSDSMVTAYNMKITDGSHKKSILVCTQSLWEVGMAKFLFSSHLSYDYSCCCRWCDEIWEKWHSGYLLNHLVWVKHQPSLSTYPEEEICGARTNVQSKWVLCLTIRLIVTMYTHKLSTAKKTTENPCLFKLEISCKMGLNSMLC